MRASASTGRALRELGRPVFTTREVAAVRGASVAATTGTAAATTS